MFIFRLRLTLVMEVLDISDMSVLLSLIDTYLTKTKTVFEIHRKAYQGDDEHDAIVIEVIEIGQLNELNSHFGSANALWSNVGNEACLDTKLFGYEMQDAGMCYETLDALRLKLEAGEVAET